MEHQSLYRVHFSVSALVIAGDAEAAHMAMQRALWDLEIDGHPVSWARRSIRRIRRLPADVLSGHDGPPQAARA